MLCRFMVHCFYGKYFAATLQNFVSSEGRQMKRATVLLAERSREGRRKLRKLLELGEEFAIIGETGDGLEALEMICTLRPQMVVISSSLPRLDGISVLRVLKKENIEKPLVIMTTGSRTAYCEDEAHRQGADAFLERPMGEEPIIEHMSALLRFSRCESAKANLDAQIVSILDELGVSPCSNGYQYLRTGINLSIKNDDVSCGITKILYPNLSTIYGDSAGCIERAIRRAIESAWEEGDPTAQEKYFGYSVNSAKKRPTNSVFITAIAHRLKVEQMAKNGDNTPKED